MKAMFRSRQWVLTRKVWRAMINRCNNTNDNAYINYGGRGIKVCERWMNFDNFVKDLGLKPNGLTIDRINNDEGYNPNNCRWISRAEQNKNRRKVKRNSVLITFEGLTMSVYAWALFLKINKINTFQVRICTYKWSLIKAATTPLLRKHSKV